MDATNHQIRLAARPTGEPVPSDWAHTEEPVPTPRDGQILVRVTHLSLDPDRKSTRLNSSHVTTSRMPSSA